MNNSLNTLAFVSGALTMGLIAYLFFRRQMANLQLASVSNSERLREMEAQLARQTEEFSRQLASKAKEHMEELDLLSKERRRQEEAHHDELKTKVREAENRGYEDGKRQAELRADEKAKAFSVIVRPFIRKSRDDGFIKKMNRLEVGYQYQLQINGIPCFEPHVVIVRRYEEKEVNQEVIERMTRLALEAAQGAVKIQAVSAGAFIPVADSPVIEG